MMKIVVVSDMKLSNSPDDIIKTHALGTCLGITIYDRKNCVGGLLHFQLPSSKKNPERAKQNPFMYADTGIPLLFQKAYELGATKSGIDVKVAGGGSPLQNDNIFNIGHRNYVYMKKLFWKNRVVVSAERVGGSDPVTMWLDMSTGQTFLKIRGQVSELKNGDMVKIA